MKFFFRKLEDQSGLTLLELIVTAVIILILASAAMPLSKMGERRAKEMELRQALRDLRLAIDRFKDDWDSKRISHSESDIANEETGYPRSLGVLVEGVPVPDPNDKKIRKYLRRIPIDPFTRSTEWGTRCYEDEPDSTISCDRDVYDVYSRSDQLGLDGTKVQTW
ncbi:MAG: type II secretion system protein [Candidatus Manganitrophus sp.]|nr:type II secretion system protein [Candidatus Manganitrophus sp.]WDT71269.1 MAG: type II secretion system protein [Candidatus Manganitrophus sp.]WDT81428.1 MAG: type II secretion system protein [Candidatus Manganitrophus sp.]